MCRLSSMVFFCKQKTAYEMRISDWSSDVVKQQEVGVKWRMGDLNLAVTGFHATTSEQNFEVTSQRFFNRSFKAYGAELEASYRIGQFSFSGGTTYTDAQIKNDQITPRSEEHTSELQSLMRISYA